MPYPTTPTLSLARISDTSFSATVTGGAYAFRVFYRLVGAASDTTGPILLAPGTTTVSALAAQGQYWVYVVADDGSSYSLPSTSWISLTSTDSLFAALQARFAANPSTVTLIPGGLWTGEVPERDGSGNVIEPPFAYFNGSPTITAPTFENELEYTQVTFQVYALGYANCEACVRQLKSTFDYQTLPFAAAYSVGLWPLRWRIYNERIRWKDNRLVHRGEVGYRISVQRLRADGP